MSTLLQSPCPARRCAPFSGQRTRQPSPTPAASQPTAVSSTSAHLSEKSTIRQYAPFQASARTSTRTHSSKFVDASYPSSCIDTTAPASMTKNSSTASGSGQSDVSVDRRTLLLITSSLVTSYLQQSSMANPAQATEATSTSQAPGFVQRGLSRYIRKKKLDPLDTYVPLALEAKDQLNAAGQIMLDDAIAARELLRSGPFSGLRENIRALGEYAVVNGKQQEAGPLVNGFFRSLEAFDFLLSEAAKDQAVLDKSTAQAKLQDTVQALDNLLATVPPSVMERSQAVFEATLAKARQAAEAEQVVDDEALEKLL